MRISWARVLVVAVLAAGCVSSGRPAPPAAPAMELSAEQDHQRLMNLLGIDSIRPGRNGNDPSAPNYANYDDSKANPYPNLPDPLMMSDGRPVTSAAMWRRERRPELAELFAREIYGRMPAHTPAVHWDVVETTNEDVGGVAAVTQKLAGHVDNSAYRLISVDIEMSLTLPAHAAHAPVILNFGWLAPPPNFHPPPEPGPSAKEQVLARGWGYAVLDPRTAQPDNGAGLTHGVIGLVNHGQPRAVDDWGALRAWGWAASRALDYFQTRPEIDARRVAIEGHSRFGKAALVTMADDERFAIGFISSSGMGGANLARRNWGETVENVAGSGEYHWMAGNYIKYAGPLNAGDMPVDAHELIALAAPRPLFVSAGAQQGDGWVDARGMFMATVAAGPVYRLLGKRDLGTREFPPIETALVDGDLAYRQHSSGHTPGPNWPTFLDFAARYFEPAHR
jgi:(4-O-methyl)-D-glucuronate---lignin esterase